ncbi:helix-turn-helix domain-containing protein [Nocardioides sp. ChNu-153]|uniref:helix-turn-helix domain-containing protein n=1 Tax=unclassified Nocardioides TaxID=2615069 RepID=UPI002406F7C8|nr:MULTISPECIES: helix-turn-helix domain-containing protein [unclassified Nocardioides]MDF9715596.1 helix-turn-helix domain-containing protein [Nocardioides sp. ChNu-99]MDN7121268.1 helix-turn-helix domain-containing protein [Nocardioides sp. ChNu-153]
MLTNVAVLAYDGLAPFELGLLCEAFGVDRTDDGLPPIDFAVCGPRTGPLATTVPGLSVTVDHGLERLATADLVAVPALPRDEPPGEAVLEALRAAHDRGARLLSVCSGAFVLGAAGLLDGRECTTHWMYTDELASRFPRARVVPEVLYVDAGQVVTSAGTAAGLDACLHVWRQELGSAVAGVVARRMVVPPQREGGQAQFIARAVPECTAETLGPLLAWVAENLDADLGVEELARRAHMSPRTFARRFRDETGTTPHAWVTAQRVRLAEELLERTNLPVERIAADVGFVNAATLRHHFTRVRGVSPQRYRRTFACDEGERAATA